MTDSQNPVKNHLFNITDNPENRYTFYPINNAKYYEHYKGQLAVFWTAEEVILTRDRSDFEKLNETERTFIKNILSFFAASDGIVADLITQNLSEEITAKEVATLFRFQAMMEDIHGEMYSLMVENIIPDSEEQRRCLNAINEMPAIKLKGQWALKWMNQENNTLPRRLVAQALIEGIHFSGSFCAIQWLGQRNIMPGLMNANEFIRRDENSHVKTSVMLYNDLLPEHRLSREEMLEIVIEAVDIEKEFMTVSIPCSMLGMNGELMKQYIEYVADQLLLQLGYDKNWGTKNPFDFMVNMSLENKTNFFEHRVSEYNKSGVGTSDADRELVFDDDDEDF